MLKLIVFFVGLGVGLAGGIYWSAKNPTQANTVAAAEERQFIEMQLKASTAIKQKLDQLANRQQQAQTSGGHTMSSAVGSMPAAVTPSEINDVRSQQDQQVQRLQQRLSQLPK